VPEPTYLLAKAASALGGLLGGLTMMAYIKPISITDAALRGGVSTGTGIIISQPLIEWLGTPHTLEFLLLFGFVIGFLSWSVLSLVARFFSKAEKENKDIVDVVKELKN
jgi:hypothetical protein